MSETMERLSAEEVMLLREIKRQGGIEKQTLLTPWLRLLIDGLYVTSLPDNGLIVLTQRGQDALAAAETRSQIKPYTPALVESDLLPPTHGEVPAHMLPSGTGERRKPGPKPGQKRGPDTKPRAKRGTYKPSAGRQLAPPVNTFKPSQEKARDSKWLKPDVKRIIGDPAPVPPKRDVAITYADPTSKTPQIATSAATGATVCADCDTCLNLQIFESLIAGSPTLKAAYEGALAMKRLQSLDQ